MICGSVSGGDRSSTGAFIMSALTSSLSFCDTALATSMSLRDMSNTNLDHGVNVEDELTLPEVDLDVIASLLQADCGV